MAPAASLRRSAFAASARKNFRNIKTAPAGKSLSCSPWVKRKSGGSSRRCQQFDSARLGWAAGRAHERSKRKASGAKRHANAYAKRAAKTYRKQGREARKGYKASAAASRAALVEESRAFNVDRSGYGKKKRGKKELFPAPSDRVTRSRSKK